MGPVSRWAVNRPWQAIIAWVVLLIVIFGAAATHAGKYNNSFSLPNTDSTKAQNLLVQKFGSTTNNSQAQILFSAGGSTILNPAVKTQMDKLVAEVQAVPSVQTVTSPYSMPIEQAGQMGLVSKDGSVGKINIVFKMPDADVPLSDAKQIVDDVDAVSNSALVVGVQGNAIAQAVTAPPDSEIVGIIAAILIMLIMFGSVIAAGLPLLTALIGLGAGLSLLAIAANFIGTASFAPTLAAMIGLGVGFDYSLFLINRYRQAVFAGSEHKQAALIAVGTAGRAIVFAALTVIIALSGLFVLGLSFLSGLAIGAGVTVIAVMITAVTLLPALISLLGKRALGWRMPWAGKPGDGKVRGKRFAAYAVLVEKRRWLFGICALVLMLILATPALGMREGFPDNGGNPYSDPQRTAYDLTSSGFGVGANGPLLVVAELPKANDLAGAQALSQALSSTPGVAFASPVVAGTPAVSQDGTAALITVVPTTGPQDPGTQKLLDQLRQTTIPNAVKGTGVTAYVGGTTAISEDFSDVLADKLPEFLLVVVGLGFIVLMILFRSLLVPLTATLTSLLSYAAALGITVFVFQDGNLDWLFSVTAVGPILPFLPVMLFAILFGLSMDYHVFLVSRMQEEWDGSHDNKHAVRTGLSSSGVVVVAAATIMFSVFLSFVFQSNNTIKMFGLALAMAVALDAFVVRLVLVPSAMTIFGKANWYIPRWLGKILPKVSIESSATPEKKEDEKVPEPV